MRVYSCYFSPNDPLEVFETQILLHEESLSEAAGQILIGGDFNSKSLEWGEAGLDRRGILFGEMLARNDLIILNQDKEYTFTLFFSRWGRFSFSMASNRSNNEA